MVDTSPSHDIKTIGHERLSKRKRKYYISVFRNLQILLARKSHELPSRFFAKTLNTSPPESSARPGRGLVILVFSIANTHFLVTMPTVQPGSKVLVSGANGFIAMWVVRTLLEKGYAVRGTVRSQERGQHLTDTFKEYGDKFELVVVKDITTVRVLLIRIADY